MGIVTINEIRRLLLDKGEDVDFVEIDFRSSEGRSAPRSLDTEFAGKDFVVDCDFGVATIFFDNNGSLAKIEIC